MNTKRLSQALEDQMLTMRAEFSMTTETSPNPVRECVQHTESEFIISNPDFQNTYVRNFRLSK
ncbi:hypothetical protein SAMN04487950_3904 [Halogranum rubrum]|uniref:Uncharacterized protein n=1 Tax=Halogranum rubrum TaxID=553466 RepID=A0A1I4HY31_9EURY|nr:hypothetical protein SAMN04487950_3904 [Halogranum rubrum]